MWSGSISFASHSSKLVQCVLAQYELSFPADFHDANYGDAIHHHARFGVSLCLIGVSRGLEARKLVVDLDCAAFAIDIGRNLVTD